MPLTSFRLRPLREASRITLVFEDKKYKLWKDSMSFAYFAGQDAVKRLRRLHEKAEKVSNNSLKKLEGVIFAEFDKKVATQMQEEQTTLQTLQKCVDIIIIEQWVIMYLHHPNNIQYA